MSATCPAAATNCASRGRCARTPGRTRTTRIPASTPFRSGADVAPATAWDRGVNEAAQRKIIHVDMDAFYASVEQRDDPALRGQPVVVAWRGARSVVCAASYEARTFGVRSAMPAVRAERLCPQAIFVPPDFVRYKAVSRQVREIFARHTDLIEPLSLDEAYLDVTRPKQALGSATAIANSIRDAIREETQLTASAGIAPNKFLAKIASDWNKPDGQFVLKPHMVDAFLAPLPVGKLPGVGKVMEAKLAELGIATCTDLRGFGTDALEQRFGRWGRRLHELSRGIDERAVQAERPTLQVSAEDTFERDLPLDELEPHIRRLAGKAWAGYLRERLQHPERIARTVVLKLKTSDFRTLTRSLTATEPPTSEQGFADIGCGLRGRVDLPASTLYRLVGIGIAGFIEPDGSRAQDDLFAR
ncbi:MAG: DNA polymerase IV [Lysobacteraceae bacterium]|nr:MAG: DNA polymerase IV [Xanthomonadaceae bacterium]